MAWESEPTPEFDAWFDGLPRADQEHVVAAVIYLEREGPAARMPLSRPIERPTRCNMRELRPASSGRSEIRILYAFDHRRTAVLLLGGDKAGRWRSWYDENIPKADRIFADHVERSRGNDQQQHAPSAERKPTRKPRRRGRRRR